MDLKTNREISEQIRAFENAAYKSIQGFCEEHNFLGHFCGLPVVVVNNASLIAKYAALFTESVFKGAANISMCGFNEEAKLKNGCGFLAVAGLLVPGCAVIDLAGSMPWMMNIAIVVDLLNRGKKSLCFHEDTLLYFYPGIEELTNPPLKWQDDPANLGNWVESGIA